jgi:hypothetical protein
MDCSEQRQRFRRRVLVISLATRKTFEIVLAVSLNRLNSRAMSKDSLVEKWTMLLVRSLSFGVVAHWMSNEDQYLREYASALRKK